jgi:hypothetical protein
MKPMNPTVQVVAIVATVAMAAFVLELVRKRKLREEYSLLWLLAIVVMAALALDRGIVDWISHVLGVSYAPSALFIVAFAVGFLLVLHFSIVISRLVERNKRLTQEIGLLKLHVEEIESSCRHGEGAR